MCNLLSKKGLGVKRVAVALGCLFLFFVNPARADIKESILEALKSGDTTRAIQQLQEQIQLDPSYHLNYYYLGLIHYNREEYRKARDYFQQALSHKDKHWESLLYLGRTLLHLGDIEGAEKAMARGREKAKELKPEFEDGYGLVMLEEHKLQEADRAFRQALVYDSNKAEYHIHLGDANYQQGIYPLAVNEYEKALQLDTASLEVYYHWAEACIEMKDYNCALEKLKIVLTKDSTHAPAWNRAGNIYFRAALSTRDRDERINRFKEAIGSYRRYFELSKVEADSDHVRPFFEMAMAYININAFEEAAEYFKKVLAIPYVPKDIYFYYGKALWGTKQYEEAGDMLEKQITWASEQNSDYHSTVNEGELYTLLGDSYYYRKPKKFSKAIEYYRKALESNPDHKRVLQNIAVAYHSLKSYRQALEFYQRRIALGIDSSTAGLLKNAGYCAFNIASGKAAAGDEGMDDIDEELDEGTPQEPPPEENPDVNYNELAAKYFQEYLSYKPDDAAKVLEVLGSTYLYQLSDCTNGIKYYTQLLELDPNNCDALKSLGYAYFGGVCTKNYTKALDFLIKAYNCKSKASGACTDVNLVLWIAQAYHLRAVEKSNANQPTGDDFKSAYDWYGKVLKCEPSNEDAKKGQADTRFEF